MTIRILNEKDKQARRLRRGAEAFARSRAAALEKKLAPFLAEGEAMPDVALLAALAARRVAWLLETLSAAVDVDAGAGVALSLARSDRELARHRLADLLCHLRNFLHGSSGARQSVHPRLTERIPTQPHHLLRHAERVLAALRAPAPALPRCPGLTIDPANLAASIQPAADALSVTLAQCLARETEAVRAEEAKKRAEAGFEADHGPADRLLEALESLAGQPIQPSKPAFRRSTG